MYGYRKDYTMADDKIYSKYGKIVTMMDDLQSAGCFDTTYSQPVFRLVVTGPNGSGKDSFINSILGFPFLPPGCKTKRQMEIRILHSTEDVSPMVQIEDLKKSFTHHNECAKNIADLQRASNDTNQDRAMRLNFTTNTSADLYIISTCEDDPSNPHAKNLIRQAIGPSSNFIILVMEAMTFSDENIHKRDQWFNLIKNYDPDLSRTMVVITKPDLLPNNFNFNRLKNFLRPSNEIFNPKYGFICVKTNQQAHIEPSDQSRLEREYFCNHKVFQFLPVNDYFTIETVGEKITKWIWETKEFRKNLIYAYSKLQERLKFIEGELKIFGAEIDFGTQSKELYLQSMLMLFCDTVEKTFSGKCEEEEYNLSNTKLNKIYVDFLCQYIDYKPSVSFKNEDIIETIQKSEGSGLSGFPSGEVIYSLLDKKMEELRNELTDYFDNVYSIVNQLFKDIINRYFSRFPKAVHSIEELILSFFDKEFNKTKELTTDLAEMNFTYLYVDELNEQYKNLVQNSLLKRGYNNPNDPNNQNNNQLKNNNNYQFQENQDISFFKAIKDKDSYYQGLADYVKSLVDYIYAEVIRSLREYIPKSTGNCFIKSLKRNMRFYFLQFISKNVEFSQEFEEDQEVAQKRKYYVDSQKKLKKIIKDIEKDDQITKIVKEDNIKNIDNILESQGIKTANIEVDKEPGNQSAKNLSYKPQNKTNLFGAPPNFDKKPAVQKKTTIQNNPPLNASTKTNLFGNPQQQPSKTAIGKSTNIFGNPSTTTKKPEPTNNLFGNTTNTKKPDTAAKNNLFGNPNTKKPQTNNLFGTPNQTQNRNTNLFGNPTNQQQKQNPPQPQKQAPQQKNKDLNVSLKIDPKEGNITGVNVQGNIDPKDAYNFYQKNKQYMPSGQQMLSGAKTGMNMYNQANANNNNSNGLANLFGAPKK
jgi:hypothetical protein